MLKNGIGPFAQRIHVHTVAYPGFQRGGCLRSGPIRKVGGGGGAVHFRVRYTKSGGGGGGQFASGPIRKVGGHFRSDIRKVGREGALQV